MRRMRGPPKWVSLVKNVGMAAEEVWVGRTSRTVHGLDE